jgi:hypothetical protein
MIVKLTKQRKKKNSWVALMKNFLFTWLCQVLVLKFLFDVQSTTWFGGWSQLEFTSSWSMLFISEWCVSNTLTRISDTWTYDMSTFWRICGLQVGLTEICLTLNLIEREEFKVTNKNTILISFFENLQKTSLIIFE